MGKLIKSLFALVAFMLLSVGVASASTSVRLEQPKTPTTQNDFTITFVALDTQGNDVQVTCYKKGPSDGSFTQFDSVKDLGNGGNTDTCHVTSSIVNGDGTYQFQVSANGIFSTIATVDVNTSGPGTPTNYSKDHPDACHYVIKFRTANDSGATAKVEIYRSSTTTLVADSGSRITAIATGSNNDIAYTDSVPTCGNTYFYAVRAFSSAGAGSGLVGDGDLTATTTTSGTTPAPTSASSGQSAGVTSGAIPVTTSGVTPGAGESPTGAEVSVSPTEGVLGATKAPTEAPSGLGSFFTSKKNIFFLFLFLAAVVSAIWFWRTRSK